MTNIIFRPANRRIVQSYPHLGNIASPMFKAPIQGSDLYTNDKSTQVPATNIWEDSEKFTLQMAIPGLEKEDIQIQLNEQKIVISAGKTLNDTIKFRLREFNISTFSRTFTLPEEADTEKMEAKFAAGILTMTIAKKQKAQPRKIEVI